MEQENNLENEISTLTDKIACLRLTEMMFYLKQNNCNKENNETLCAIIAIKEKLIIKRDNLTKKGRLRHVCLAIATYVKEKEKKERYKKLKKTSLRMAKGVVFHCFSTGPGIAGNLAINGIHYLALRYPETFNQLKNNVRNFLWDTSKPNQTHLKWKNVVFSTATVATAIVLVIYCYDYCGISRWIYKDYLKQKTISELPEVLPILINDLINNNNIETGKSVIPFVSREKSILRGVVNHMFRQVTAENCITYLLLASEQFQKLSGGTLPIGYGNIKTIVKICTQLVFQTAEINNIVQNYPGILSEGDSNKLEYSKRIFVSALNTITKNNKELQFMPEFLNTRVPFLKTIANPTEKNAFINATADTLVNVFCVKKALESDC